VAIADFLPHTFTGYVSGAFTVSAESELPSTFQAWRACDGVLTAGTGWQSAEGHTASWWKVDCGVSALYLLDNYSIKISYVTYAPKNWILEGSLNGTDWVTLDTVTNSTGWATSELRNFVCDVRTTSYRYFRLNISAVNGGTRQFITELYLFGEAGAAVVIPVVHVPIEQPYPQKNSIVGY
jgi:hypothetical protein